MSRGIRATHTSTAAAPPPEAGGELESIRRFPTQLHALAVLHTELGVVVDWWGSGGQCEVVPEGLPLAVEVDGFQGGDGQCTGLGPVHAGAFEPDADELLAT